MDVAISIIVTFLLTLVNGYFSASEMAVVNAKRAVLEPEADEGDKRAKSALDLYADAGHVRAAIQDAITLGRVPYSAVAATRAAGLFPRGVRSLSSVVGVLVA